MTDDEQSAVLYVGAPHKEGLFLLVLYWLGLRRGEALGLKWSDFDWVNCIVHIQRDIDYMADAERRVGELKTSNANRYLPLSPELIDALVSIMPDKKILESEKLKGTDYVFKGEKSGEPISQATYKHMWTRLMIACYKLSPNIESQVITSGSYKGTLQSVLTAHFLRHNYCTMLCMADVPQIQVIYFMGHKDLKLIQEVYSHVDKKKQAINATGFRNFMHNHCKALNMDMTNP